jgi:hypothetical protein
MIVWARLMMEASWRPRKSVITSQNASGRAAGDRGARVVDEDEMAVLDRRLVDVAERRPPRVVGRDEEHQRRRHEIAQPALDLLVARTEHRG